MLLTAENYHSQEANLAYFSGSQMTSFMECEARTMAELRGEYVQADSTALLVGSYVDAHFSKTLNQFQAKHPEIYTRSGTLRSEFSNAEEIIARLECDELALSLLGNMNQAIVTGNIQGVPFKAMLDMLLDADACDEISKAFPGMDILMFQHNAIVDLKVMRDFKNIYREGAGYVNFIEAWNYDLKMAIYQRLLLERDQTTPPCIILAATKEKVPDIGLFHIRQSELDAAFEVGMDKLDRFVAVKNGELDPIRCEECDYCKQTKVLKRVMYLGDY